MMTTDGFHIRAMRTEEIALAAEWAAAEGWNPGLADAKCFASVDSQGFLIGELDGQPAATISIVNYDDRFAFLGFYIVRPDLRGNGFGWRIWQAAMAHAGKRTVGLDGVLAQQDNYRKSGFALAHRNIRYGGKILTSGSKAHPGILGLKDIPLSIIAANDINVFPAQRLEFLRAWVEAPEHTSRALLRDGDLVGWGVIRPCRRGFKVGPLFANDRTAAEAVLDALLADVDGGEIFLDVPQPNHAAVPLAGERGLRPMFETARMYTGFIRPVRLERIFGITTFELG
jgi:GNAT superfamily N-acetyltransferase